jgi:RNA polymerase sigma factor (TIGR02999 family)
MLARTGDWAYACADAVRDAIANNAVVKVIFIWNLLLSGAISIAPSPPNADSVKKSRHARKDRRIILISIEAVCVMSGDVGEVTILLNAMKRGDATAADELLGLVYNELHTLAKRYMRHERQDHTLQPTALINEAYMRMVGNSTDWQNHQHFIGVAATVMRRVLVDHARAHNAGKRGGNLQRVEFEEGVAFSSERSVEVIDVDDALTELQTLNPRQAQIVELRYFAELSDEQIAALLKISTRTVERDWLLAKDWLSQRVR